MYSNLNFEILLKKQNITFYFCYLKKQITNTLRDNLIFNLLTYSFNVKLASSMYIHTCSQIDYSTHINFV